MLLYGWVIDHLYFLAKYQHHSQSIIEPYSKQLFFMCCVNFIGILSYKHTKFRFEHA